MTAAKAQRRTPEHLRIDTVTAHAGYMVLRLARYPAWRITVNGQLADATTTRDDGLIVVPVPKGPVEVNADWSTTSDVIVGRCVSCAAVLLLIGLGLMERKRVMPRL